MLTKFCFLECFNSVNSSILILVDHRVLDCHPPHRDIFSPAHKVQKAPEII